MRPVALPVLIAAVLLSAGASPSAWGQYRWKDANGQMHVSDLPPPREIADKDILQRPARGQRPVVPVGSVASPAPGRAVATAQGANPSTSSRPASGPTDPALETRRQQAEADARARVRGDDERQAALRADNCRRARDQLANLDSGQRLTRQNAQGERVVLDDAARAGDADAARRVIASDCR